MKKWTKEEQSNEWKRKMRASVLKTEWYKQKQREAAEHYRKQIGKENKKDE